MASPELNKPTASEEVIIEHTPVKETRSGDNYFCLIGKEHQDILLADGDSSQVICTHEELSDSQLIDFNIVGSDVSCPA